MLEIILAKLSTTGQKCDTVGILGGPKAVNHFRANLPEASFAVGMEGQKCDTVGILGGSKSVWSS